jgi:Zn-dependent M28 family amino/carboxypeptidase
LIIWTDQLTPDQKKLPKHFNIPKDGLRHNIILVHAATAPVSVKLTANTKVYRMLQYNVIGMLKGKTKPDEFIILSAHYDHEGVYKTKKKKDSIMNGANDNASGTTALLQLAKYYAQQQNNERTILFCAFSGEELGLLGAEEFSRQVNAEKVIAMFNLEMLGVNQFGKGKVFITGREYSALPDILAPELRKHGLTVINEPDLEKQLFRRSDNFPFAQKGIPAHTIMASDDDEKCYHEPCDDIRRIDFNNLNNIIMALSKAISPFTAADTNPGRITRPVE